MHVMLKYWDLGFQNDGRLVLSLLAKQDCVCSVVYPQWQVNKNEVFEASQNGVDMIMNYHFLQVLLLVG